MKPAYDIVFLGTPAFAVPTLKALHESRHHVKAVVTQPDRPKGRGRRLQPPPIKEIAQHLGYPVIQPQAVKSKEMVSSLGQTGPDFLVVVAFGQILNQALLDIAEHGAINVHASLLPKYRGPAPIQWALINQETQTGVTTMQMDAGVDTGDILLTAEAPIHPTDTAATLHDRLAELGARLLIDTLTQFSTGSVKPIPQDHRRASYAPMLQKADGRIQWDQSAKSIEAFIRGVTPWPGAYSFAQGKRIRFLEADVIEADTEKTPGTVIRGFPGELRIAAAKGVLSVRMVQAPSGKRMDVESFLRGMPLQPGTVFQ